MDKYGNIYGPFIIDPTAPPPDPDKIYRTHPATPTTEQGKTLSEKEKKKLAKEKRKLEKRLKNPNVDKVKKTPKWGGSLEDMARLNLMIKR